MEQFIIGIFLGLLITALTTDWARNETNARFEHRVLGELAIVTVTMWMLLLADVLLPVYMLYASYILVRAVALQVESIWRNKKLEGCHLHAIHRRLG